MLVSVNFNSFTLNINLKEKEKKKPNYFVTLMYKLDFFFFFLEKQVRLLV